MTFIAVGGISAVLIVVAVKILQKQNEIAAEEQRAAAEEQKKREIYEKNMKIINSVEKKPELLQISNTTDFSCAEEKRINLEFREFLKNRNALTTAKAHEKYLAQKASAYRALEQTDKAEAVKAEIQRNKATIAQDSERKIVFRDLYNGIAYKDSQIKTGLSNFADIFTEQADSLLSEFFEGVSYKIVSAGYGEKILFFPGYVLRYNKNMVFCVVPYSSLRVSSIIRTVPREGRLRPADEIAEIRYLHQNKDGQPDKRYSAANNPRIVYVYTGSVTIQGPSVNESIRFGNRSDALSAERKFKNYLDLVNKTHSDIITAILENDEELLHAGSITAYKRIKAEAERARQEEKKKAERTSLEAQANMERLVEAIHAANAAELQRKEAEALCEKRKKEEAQTKAEEKRKRQQKGEDERKKMNERLRLEKYALLGQFTSVRYIKIPTFSVPTKSEFLEQEIVNKALLDMINDANTIQEAMQYNLLLSKNKQKIEQVRQMNLATGRAAEDGLRKLTPMQMPKEKNDYLPERTKLLGDYFTKTEGWSDFKWSIRDMCASEKKSEDIYARFFARMDYCTIQNGRNMLLLFPYFVAVFEPGKPLNIQTYAAAKLTVNCTDKEEMRITLPEHGELLQERYKYQNLDGTPDRRHRDNPLIKTIRYTTVTIRLGLSEYSFPVNANAKAMQLENAFHAYCTFLTSGLVGEVYKLVEKSAQTDIILKEIDKLQKEEAERIALEKQREEEQMRRLEEARIAAEKDAEEKKKAIIQRQRELNEERKKEAQRKAEAHQRVMQMFDDDFSADSEQTVEADKTMATSVEVVGNRTISNNVFKVTMKITQAQEVENLVAYFVSADGDMISNRKKIPAENCGDITVGFVLNSGIDFTKMSKCYMQIEAQDTLVGKIDFKMNISFYSDF